MPRQIRIAGISALALLLFGIVTVVGVRWWREEHRSDLAQAMAIAPGDAERFSFTDWAGVRRELGADLDADSSATDVGDFLDRAFDRDLSPSSAMLSSAATLQDSFGFSPASVDWELLAQGTSGAAVLLRMPADTDFDAIGETLDGLGYQRPESETGVWEGGEDLVARVGGLSPEFQYVALDAADGLVISSDTASYAKLATGVASGAGDLVTGLDDVVAAAGQPLSAAVYTGDNVCGALAMSQADESDQDEARQLIADAGGVNPMTGFAMASQPGGQVRVAMGFESSEQARANADARAALATGPAVGQGGDFADRFSLRRASAQDDVVVLELDPEPDAYVLSDLTSGPVLFATC